MINMCLGMFLLGYILYGILYILGFKLVFLMLWKFSTVISSNIFSVPFCLSLSLSLSLSFFFLYLWDAYNVNFGVPNVDPVFSETIFIYLHSSLFPSFCFTQFSGSGFHHSVLQTTYTFLCLLPYNWIHLTR